MYRVVLLLFSLFLGRRVDGFRNANYEETSFGVKGIVSGLTTLTNTLFRKDKEILRNYDQPSLAPKEVLAGVVGDFENGYLFSGGIDTQIYTENCRFTDPTLSFVGLSTFENNIRNLKPVLNFFVANTLIVLYNAQLDEKNHKVKAQWRMSGNIRLPWQPKLELTGNTALSYNPNDDGRIFDYFEQWDLEASKALFQLLQPAQIIPTASFPSVIDDIPVIDETKNIQTGIIRTIETTERGSQRQQKTINVSQVKVFIRSCLQHVDNGKETIMMPLIKCSVSSLIQAVPLNTLQIIQAVGNVEEGIQQATTAAFTRLEREQWTLQFLCSTNEHDKVLGTRGSKIRFSSTVVPSIDIDTMGVTGGQTVDDTTDTTITTITTTPLSYVVMGQTIQFFSSSSSSSMVDTLPWQLGYYDEEWMVFVRSDGDIFIVTKQV